VTALQVMMGRHLVVEASRGGAVRLEFAAMCGQALGAADYMAVAEQFHTVVLTGVPQFTRATMNELRRFITLVDLLYERSCRLVCSAEVPFESLFDQMGLDEIAAAAAETAKVDQVEAEVEVLAASEIAVSRQSDSMRVSGDGGSSGRSTTMFQV
jgi:predicted ATPase